MEVGRQCGKWKQNTTDYSEIGERSDCGCWEGNRSVPKGKQWVNSVTWCHPESVIS